MNTTTRVLDGLRGSVKLVMNYVARLLNSVSGGRLKPTHITLAAVLGHMLVAYLLATRHPIWAGGLLIFFGLFDALDGELARLQQRVTPGGMLLDSISDRAKEIMLYIGAAYFFVVLEYPYVAVWAVAACGASVLVSYTNAWGDVVLSTHSSKKHEINKSLRTGLMTYDVRIFLFIAGLLTSLLPEVLIIITVLSAFTALSRVIQTLRKL